LATPSVDAVSRYGWLTAAPGLLKVFFGEEKTTFETVDEP
jgi:hypothetical protein